MTPREAAEQIVPSKERCKSGTMLLAREEAIAEIEQIIQAACDATTRVRWTKEPPTEMGAWWRRLGPGARHVVRYVILRENTLCVEVNGCPLDVESVGGEWSDKPIQEPSDE